MAPLLLLIPRIFLVMVQKAGVLKAIVLFFQALRQLAVATVLRLLSLIRQRLTLAAGVVLVAAAVVFIKAAAVLAPRGKVIMAVLDTLEANPITGAVAAARVLGAVVTHTLLLEEVEPHRA